MQVSSARVKQLREQGSSMQDALRLARREAALSAIKQDLILGKISPELAQVLEFLVAAT